LKPKEGEPGTWTVDQPSDSYSSRKGAAKGDFLLIQGSTGPDLWFPHGIALKTPCFEYYMLRGVIWAEGRVRVGQIMFDSQLEAVSKVKELSERGFQDHLLKEM
jgi:hypothetical protein